MKEIQAIIEPSRLYDVVVALQSIRSMPDFTMTEVRLFPTGRPDPSTQGKSLDVLNGVEMIRIECVVPGTLVSCVLAAIERTARVRGSESGRIVIHAVEEPAEVDAAPKGT